MKKEKILKLDLDFTNLVREAEGAGFDGWKLPIWAKIKSDNIVLSSGAPVSAGTSFVDCDGEIATSWVGNIDCWNKEDDEDSDCQIGEYSSFYNEEEWNNYVKIRRGVEVWQEIDLDKLRKEYGTDYGFPARRIVGIDLDKLRKEYGTDYENIPYSESIVGRCVVFALKKGYDVLEVC